MTIKIALGIYDSQSISLDTLKFIAILFCIESSEDERL